MENPKQMGRFFRVLKALWPRRLVFASLFCVSFVQNNNNYYYEREREKKERGFADAAREAQTTHRIGFRFKRRRAFVCVISCPLAFVTSQKDHRALSFPLPPARERVSE